MKILVTGGAGNIGGSLSRKLVERSDFFIDIIDDLSTGSENKLPDKKFKNWNFFHIDVNNYENILKSIGERDYDFIFHYAAVVGVNRTLKNPKLVLNDIEGIKNILEFSKQKKVNRIFFSSSSEVYGEPVEIPQKEATTPLNSKLPYAVVKNLAESYFRTYKKEDNINYTIAGPICESSDIFAKNIKLSKQEIGNILIIKNTGAYGKVMSSNYNSRILPTEILVNKEDFAVIYSPEKIEKIIEEDIIPHWL